MRIVNGCTRGTTGPPREAPWKFLGQLGFDRPAWTAFQHRYPELSAVRERSGFAIQTLDP